MLIEFDPRSGSPTVVLASSIAPRSSPQCTMAFIFSNLLNWLRSLFFAKHLEVTIVGLQVRSLPATGTDGVGERQDFVRSVARARLGKNLDLTAQTRERDWLQPVVGGCRAHGRVQFTSGAQRQCHDEDMGRSG